MKILIIGPAWVGDMVMAQSLFQLLKNYELHVMAPSWNIELLERMPEVSQALLLPFNRGDWQFYTRWQLGKQLRAERYEQSIVLPNSWKSALIPFFAKIPKRTGWLGEYRVGLLNDIRFLNKQRYPMMVERFLALGLPPNSPLPQEKPYPRLQVARDQAKQVCQQLGLTIGSEPVVALCPGAEFGPSKQWPARHFAALAQTLLEQGHQVWLFGSPKDQPIAMEIQDLTENRCINLVGRTKLGEAVDLLSLAEAVVSNDSGLMHVAAALDKPLVALYGSSSAQFTPPLSPKARCLSLNLACSPCFKRVCPLEHHRCLEHLLPEDVLSALKAL